MTGGTRTRHWTRPGSKRPHGPPGGRDGRGPAGTADRPAGGQGPGRDGSPERGQGPGTSVRKRRIGLLLYGLLGVLFGMVVTGAEVLSWFRIQEMFRFQSFHMYGIIASAVAVAAVSLRLLRRRMPRAATGADIEIPPKRMGRGVRYVVGGLLFGLGWALTGACPGPLLALVGNGVGVFGVALLSAVAGVWSYGHLRPRLPH